MQRKWIQLSLLSVFGQLLLETGARHFGNGIMKVEPKTLKNVLVYAGTNRIPKDLYDGILQHIAEGSKDEACKEATHLIANETNIEETIVNDTEALLKEVRKRRGVREHSH